MGNNYTRANCDTEKTHKELNRSLKLSLNDYHIGAFSALGSPDIMSVLSSLDAISTVLSARTMRYILSCVSDAIYRVCATRAYDLSMIEMHNVLGGSNIISTQRMYGEMRSHIGLAEVVFRDTVDGEVVDTKNYVISAVLPNVSGGNSITGLSLINSEGVIDRTNLTVEQKGMLYATVVSCSTCSADMLAAFVARAAATVAQEYDHMAVAGVGQMFFESIVTFPETINSYMTAYVSADNELAKMPVPKTDEDGKQFAELFSEVMAKTAIHMAVINGCDITKATDIYAKLNCKTMYGNVDSHGEFTYMFTYEPAAIQHQATVRMSDVIKVVRGHNKIGRTSNAAEKRVSKFVASAGSMFTAAVLASASVVEEK